MNHKHEIDNILQGGIKPFGTINQECVDLIDNASALVRMYSISISITQVI